MKSESEIRKHRDNIRKALNRPCGCANTVHRAECMGGAMIMRAIDDTLSWILGENESLGEFIEEVDFEANRL